ncbi:MAG: rod shape-determining protein RodA [Rickettsiales bacterium]|nr:rod shape-determining protein RodA [Rickettsiales bacterium]|tara:strand:+ start:1523 stop:2674 length:1152 start_codon:yes stop_codon:yes gene_type:complete
MISRDTINPAVMTLGQRLWHLNWFLILLICALASVGFMMLYSAGNGSYSPWAERQMLRFGLGMCIMLAIALTDIRIWLKYAYLFYAGSLIMLIAVEAVGTVGMGAQRWIDLKVFHLQPSELMKIALVLALARYFHGLSLDEVARPTYLVLPTLLVAAPIALVMRQPDLGTSLLLLMGSGAMFFLAGVRMWKFVLVGLTCLSAIPVIWSMLHVYQKKRIMTFLSPESDPLGAGYHALQSFIALGSGGVSGKGFLKGTQSHLSFLPEMQTDFIFTMYAEEFGLIGGILLLALYTIVVAYTFAIAMRSRNHFGRLVCMGIATMFFLYFFVNIAMVTGLTPVVGVPLPLISYGGTAMMTVLIGFGLVMNVSIHRDMLISRHGEVSNT